MIPKNFGIPIQKPYFLYIFIMKLIFFIFFYNSVFKKDFYPSTVYSNKTVSMVFPQRATEKAGTEREPEDYSKN